MSWWKKAEDRVENAGAALAGELEIAVGHPLYPFRAYMLPVDAGLVRGSWPTRQMLDALFASGFKLVINLCAERSDYMPVRVAGMTAMDIAIVDGGIPTIAQIRIFLAMVREFPTYVHCEAGEGRTGCVCAAYRVKVQRWTAAEALAEAKKLGLWTPCQQQFILNLSEATL